MKGLEVFDLTTVIDEQRILIDVTFSIEAGKTMALVGHNGAGKSTLMKTIMNIVEKQEGRIKIMETYDQREHFLDFKRNIAYLPEEPMLLPELTVMQHFQLYGRSYQIKQDMFENKLTTLVEQFELREKINMYPEELSKGMRQKVQTICALLPKVSVLLIDEPFMGLDIYAKNYLITLLKEKQAEGTSILLTTHQLEEAKMLANDFVLMQQGKIVQSGPIREFESITRGEYND